MNKWAMLALPYSRFELPGWGKLLRQLGVFDDAQWRNAPQRTLRGKFHGYELNLDLTDWSDRQFYFTGRYYDLEGHLLVMTAVHPGDTFIPAADDFAAAEREDEGLSAILARVEFLAVGGPAGVVHAHALPGARRVAGADN